MTMRARTRMRSRAGRRGQSMTEVIILIALVGLALTWVVTALPNAIRKHYTQTVQVIASPF